MIAAEACGGMIVLMVRVTRDWDDDGNEDCSDGDEDGDHDHDHDKLWWWRLQVLPVLSRNVRLAMSGESSRIFITFMPVSEGGGLDGPPIS
jgi:hypothetical protein